MRLEYYILNTNHLFFQNTVVLGEVAALVAGITGAVVLSIYSTELETSGFIVSRTSPATAVLFSEPDVSIPRTSISRSSSYAPIKPNFSCRRPVIPLGPKINFLKYAASSITNHYFGDHILTKKASPLLEKSKMRWALVGQHITNLKGRFWQKLGLSCMKEKLLRPWKPYFEYGRCILGIREDDFMEAPQCASNLCVDPVIEEREITNTRVVPGLDSEMLDVATIDDCNPTIKKVMYGARILAKLVSDVSCEDPEYQETCMELMDENRIVMEEDCATEG